MAKVFADMAVSLDGFIAGPNARPGNPLGDGGVRLHEWTFGLKSWRALLGLRGGESNADDEIAKATIERSGAFVMGRRMFDEGELGWPENAPFHAPVFVVTHRPREPWVRPGGTTFNFVTDGAVSALEQAKAAAGDRDVRVAGGADVVRQLLRAGLVDELSLHVAPLLLGGGVRLFDGIGPEELELEKIGSVDSPLTTHITYRVAK